MKCVFFYQFITPIPTIAHLLPCEYLATQKAWECWQAHKRSLLICQSQVQAEKLDEYLWQFDTARFLPHNLVGEGPQGGAPVEICWPGRLGSGIRHTLINLQADVADVAVMFNEIIDFVPFEDHEKKSARMRYFAYKSLGFQLKTVPVELLDPRFVSDLLSQ